MTESDYYIVCKKNVIAFKMFYKKCYFIKLR